MLKTILKSLLVLALLIAFPHVPPAAGEADPEVQQIVAAIKEKLSRGQALTAADFKDEFSNLEKLSAARRKAGAGEAAGPIFLIGQVYDEIQDPVQAVAVYERVMKDFPASKFAEFAKGNVEILRPAAEMQKARAKLVAGVSFPDFKKQDLDGRPMSVSGLKGKVVLVDFWATFCPPCMAAMPELKRLHAKYQGQGFEILGINEDYTPEALPRAVDRLGLTWPQYHDADDELARRYGARLLPEVYLLDREGRIIARDEELKGDELEKAVRKALGLKNEN